MTHEQIISGLEALLQESKVAHAKIEYSYEYDRLKRKVKDMEERLERMEAIFKKHNIQI